MEIIIGVFIAIIIYLLQKKSSVSKEQFERFEAEIRRNFRDVYLDGLPEIKENKKKKVLLESTELIAKGQFKDAKDALKRYLREFPLNESEKAAIVDMIGLCYLYSGHLDEAIMNFQEVQLIGERIKDHYIQGLGLFEMGFANVKKGAFDEAQTSYLAAMKHFTECNSLYHLALSMSNLGITLHRQGHIEEAKKLYEKSLALAKQNNDIYIQALNYQNLGSLYHDINQIEKAQSHHEEALKLFESLDDKLDIARQLHMLGMACLDSEPEKAIKNFLTAKDLIEPTDSIEDKAANLALIAQYYSCKKDYDKAEEFFLQALPLIRKVNHKYKLAVFCANFGAVYAETERYREASELFKEALALFIYMKMNKQAIDAHISLGRTYLHLEQDDYAFKCFSDAIMNSEEIDYEGGLARSLYYSGIMKYFKFNDLDSALNDLNAANTNFKKLDIEIDEGKLTKELLEKIELKRQS